MESPQHQQKLLPAPKKIYDRSERVQMLVRLISTLVFTILGFNFANSEFFVDYPLFGVTYLSQILITPLAALVGYYVVFATLSQLKKWFERLIINTVLEIVSNFWDLQSKKIQEQRRIKQKIKSDILQQQLDMDLKNAVALDTSVLIDGRILDIAKLGFLDVPFVVPQEAVDELHLLSDNKDTLKRKKGRRGLDILKDLKKVSKVTIKALKTSKDNGEVDKILVNFCAAQKIKLVTLDFNLSKVAGISGIKVLNINELANSVKTVLIPGEELAVKIISEGKEKKQGIGYLEDGTMLVVDGSKDKVGQEVRAVVVKVIQSPAGKMIFCKLVQTPTSE